MAADMLRDPLGHQKGCNSLRADITTQFLIVRLPCEYNMTQTQRDAGLSRAIQDIRMISAHSYKRGREINFPKHRKRESKTQRNKACQHTTSECKRVLHVQKMYCMQREGMSKSNLESRRWNILLKKCVVRVVETNHFAGAFLFHDRVMSQEYAKDICIIDDTIRITSACQFWWQ